MVDQFPVITDRDIEQLRQKIGERRPVTDPFNEYAGKDAIRHFVHGIGDTNPLFVNAGYARSTRYGDIIAPPSFLFSMVGWNYPRGLPGIHGMWSGAEFDCRLPIRVNDRIQAVVYLSRVEEKHGRFAGKSVLQEWTHEFTNQDAAHVASVKQWSIRTERDAARQKNKIGGVTVHHYTRDEIERIEGECREEKQRGAEPRYWEEVRVGDIIPPLVKGPLTVTDMVAWKIGWGNRPFTFAHRAALEYRTKHPSVAIANDLGVPDMPERVHWDSDFARRVGVPAAYDFGPQRCAWMGQLITNWIGDDGFITRLRVELRGFNLIGDTTWCRGKVADKRREGDRHLAVCDIRAENQRRETTAKGTAIVCLPGSEKNIWPADIFREGS
jgi:acyl dehydratase